MAQKLKFGNGTFATKEGSTLAYNDESNNFKPLPFSFTRDSIATRVNKEGLIEVVGNDKPRIDYTDSADGVLLLENSATNLNTLSDPTDAQKGSTSYASVTYQDNFNWGLGNVINNAIVFLDNSTTRYAYYNSSVTSGTQYTLSFFIKMDDNSIPIPATDFLIVLAGTSFASGYNVESYGNNVYRVSVSGAAGASNTANGILKVASHSTKGFKISAFQLEANSVASSYIPTNGSSVQRAAETCNGAGNSEVFSDSSGVLFANISPLDNDVAISLSDNTFNNSISFGVYLDKISAVVRKDGGYITSGIIDTSNNAFNNNKIAIKYNSSSCDFYVNGFVIGSSSGVTYSSDVLDNLNFDRGSGHDDFYGKTKEVGYYDTALTDLELETLTSYRSLNELVTELNLNTL